MTGSLVQVNGRDVQKLLLSVPGEGVWIADLDVPSIEPLSGRISITFGGTTLSGTVIPQGGSYGLQRKVRVLAGAAGWRSELTAQSYRNDAGVKPSKIAADAAAAVGETLGTFAGGAAKLGAHYLRIAGPASKTLENVARGVPWWVDYSGVTHVAARATNTPSADTYTVITHNPRTGCLTLSVSDLQSVGIGSVITEGVDAPFTISAFELEVTPDGLRLYAWSHPEGRSSSLVDSLRAITERLTDQRITWPVRYRVVDMAGDRVDLQIVKKSSGAPDVLSVPQWPGIASAHVIAARGAEVIVQFVGGDPSDPIVTGFAGRGSNGAIAKRLVLGASSGEGADAARKGDVVALDLVPYNFTGTVGGSPATGLLTPIAPQAFGTVITGAPGVGIGSDRAA